MKYKGHYIEEYVDKDKLIAYFDWFKENNHLFKDFTFDACLLDEFQDEAVEKSKNMDEEKGENPELPRTETEIVPNNHSSHLRNKYMEDIESNTVANNLANLIVHFERDKSWGQNQMKDEEEIYYSDDEEEILSNSEDEELLDEIQRSMNLIR